MENEFEIIRYPKINNANLFIVALEYRTPHLHRDFELSLVLEGQLTMVSNNERYLGCVGDLMLLNPNQPHELYTHGEAGATVLCLQISPRFFRDTLPAISDIHFDAVKLHSVKTDGWLSVLSRILKEAAIAYTSLSMHCQLLCAARLEELFYTLLEYVSHRFLSFADQQAIERKAERISRLITFVETNFMHKINLGEFAEAEGLSLNHMSYFVKCNLNQTFQEYVASVRYYHARKLLLTENKRLLDICLESGFPDPRSLTRAFVSKTGMNPDDFRRKHTVLTEENQYLRSPHSSQRLYSDEEAARILDYLLSCQ